MANKYVRSTDGNNADNGTTWALAKATVAGGASVAAAGDTIFVSQAHSESGTSVSLSPSSQGTQPISIVGANDAAEPPSAVSTAPVIGSTTGSINTTSMQNAYFYGLDFRVGTASSSNTPTFSPAPSAGGRQVFESCKITLSTTGSGASIQLNGNLDFLGCELKFSATGQTVFIGGGVNRFKGCSIASGSSAITTLFKFNVPGVVICEGCDFSNAAAAVSLYDHGSSSSGMMQLRFTDCKLPASWSGSLVASRANLSHHNIVELINCSAGSTNYAYTRETRQGVFTHETTVKLAASDGTTTLSWKLVSDSSCSFNNNQLVSEDIYKWNSFTGSALTATVEVVTDGVTLKDDECYLEVFYLGSSSQPIATRITDAKADFLATAANQASSSASWTTTGLSSPTKQALSVTFTPQMVGFVIARVVLAKASTTVYVDPVLTIT